VRRRLWAEAVTDRLAAPAFRALGPAERVELVDLLAVTRRTVRAATNPATGSPPGAH
jgi:hypothetical protein